MTTLTASQKSQRKQWIYVINIIVFIILFIFWTARNLAESQAKVISSSDVGTAITANYSDGGFESDKTRVETSGGVFHVYGSISIIKGEPFTIEERKNGNKMLCRTGTDDCRKIVS